jgi:TRAP-type C4-dicarboxylate transport system substrate-binding protein
MKTIGALAAVCAFVALSARAEPVTLKFGTTSNPITGISKYFDRWSAEVSKANPDLLAIKVYHGELLGNMRTIYDSTRNGVADIGWISPFQVPGKFERMSVAQIPYLALVAEYGAAAMWRLAGKGAFGNELDEVRMIAVHTYPGSALHTSFPIAKVDDVKGRKIAAVTRQVAASIAAIGGVPISLPLASSYQGIQSHTVDGLGMGFGGMRSFKIHEVAKYHTFIDLGGSCHFVAVNKESWTKLPEAAQRILSAASGEAMSRAMGKMWDDEIKEAIESISKLPGQQMVHLSPAETARAKQLLEASFDDWKKATPGADALIAAFKAEYAAIERGG